MKYWLRIGNDYLEQAKPYRTLGEAKRAFQAIAESLARYDQPIDATIHIAKSMDEVQEYPEYILSLNDDGRVVTENA